MKNLLTFSCLLFFILTSWDKIYSQGGSINNTLGSAGSFVIKDATTTFLNLNSADGYLNLSKSLNLLETSGSAVGVIYKGGNRFIHNYTPPVADGFNTFVGINSGNFTMDGTDFQVSYNTAVGHSTLANLTTGYANSAFGSLALNSNTTGYHNSAFGTAALYSNAAIPFSIDGNNNSAFGYEALYSNTDGNNNSAFGGEALYSNTTGIDNSAFGRLALTSNTTGIDNSAFGNDALKSNTEGSKNSAFGYSALFSTTNDQNSAFGYYAGYNPTSGSNNTFLGYNAQPSAAYASDEIVLGDGNIAVLRCQAGSISSLSDRRDKKNIKYLPLGLDFLMKIKPRLFYWDRREWYEDGISDGSKMNKTPTAGFIAQELDSVQINTGAEWLNLVLKSNPERIEATPGNLFPIVVKAIQDLKFENDALAEDNAKLQNELELLRSSIAGIVKAEVKAAFLRAVENKESAAEVSLPGSTN